ncbi:MAG: hypothetical protein IPM39_29060 [Chloroflexi bacterium]|nr:hypothetical protein [Chloroflexota bacterium]
MGGKRPCCPLFIKFSQAVGWETAVATTSSVAASPAGTTAVSPEKSRKAITNAAITSTK